MVRFVYLFDLTASDISGRLSSKCVLFHLRVSLVFDFLFVRIDLIDSVVFLQQNDINFGRPHLILMLLVSRTNSIFNKLT